MKDSVHVHWRHVANTAAVRGGDAALYQVTLSTFRGNNASEFYNDFESDVLRGD